MIHGGALTSPCLLCGPPQVWRQKAQYLQHKQNKAEATTIKHKSSSESKSKGILITLIIKPNDLSLLWISLLSFCHKSCSIRDRDGVTKQSSKHYVPVPRTSPRCWSHRCSSSLAAVRRVPVTDWTSTAGNRGKFPHACVHVENYKMTFFFFATLMSPYSRKNTNAT